MDNYSRCRQFVPPGWGSARTLAPCNRIGRSVAFRVAECRPAHSPMIIQANAGMNMAKDGDIRDNGDPCHGRNFIPPSNQAPINVQLKMCPVPDNNANFNEMQQQDYAPISYSQNMQSTTGRDFCEPRLDTTPLPRCPPGVKVERTLPIIPARRLQESYFKMPNASVYKSDYVPRQAEPTLSFAPERMVVESQGEFENESLTKHDYKPMPVCPYKKPPWAFRKPREESTMRMNGISSYKIDYVPKDGKPAPSAKPERFIDPDPPSMDDKTVYQVEYIPRELPTPPSKMSRKQMLSENMYCVPFDGLTVYKRDYIPKKARPAGSVVDKERAYAQILSPMDGTTTYKSSYEPFYFDNMPCIPADIYDEMYPPKDKCCDVRCYPEPTRELEYPTPPPVPPCQPIPEKDYCPTPEEMRCAPRSIPCVPPIKLKKQSNYDGSTTISVEHNMKRECQREPIEYICPPQPCKAAY
ncbi:unnamed protein product [Orchesella dallaii]|uniref:Stabilizer of axonemal microtubules 1 n=1 Tax=Orchesella dallaii TaxID=48710 RepID=A0ABP1QIV6_9HEXA